MPAASVVSRRIRSCASWRCSGVNHRVVRGVSGRKYIDMRATKKVMTPVIMKSLGLVRSVE